MSEPSESPERETFYLTTPIYYVNARPHIGHAYSTIVADVLARRHRLLGHDTWFLTGTDEHGQKIERSAAAAGVPPQQFADEVSATFRTLWKRMGITNDDFIRTTEPRHVRGAQKLFRHLYDLGHIYLSTYTGQYSIGEEMFVDGPPGTIGPDGRPTETVTEENFFFRLSAFQGPLLDLIESDRLKITPESSKNEVLSFVRGGLKDLSVSRSSFTWGIPVPEDVQRAAGVTQKHVIYVWLDALANYMTAVGYGSDDPAKQAMFERFWPADLHLVGKEITRFHCVYWPAFLLALNPALATVKAASAGPAQPVPWATAGGEAWASKWLPKAVTANGWLLFDNSKMSKSKGNVVRTETILEGFGEDVYGKQFPESTKEERDLFGADVLRYFLLREIPFGQDGSFSFEAMVTRYNADLANGYGNLVSRTLALLTQASGSTIPGHTYWPSITIQILEKKLSKFSVGSPTQFGPLKPVVDVELARISTVVCHFYPRAFFALRFSMGMDFDPITSAIKAPAVDGQVKVEGGEYGALDYVALLIGKTDEFLSSTKPWKLAKQDDRTSQNELSDALYIAAESIRIITALLYPILPNATTKAWAQLGLGDIEDAAKKGELNHLAWGGLKAGTKLGPLAPIFPRAEKTLVGILEELEVASNTSTAKVTTMTTEDTTQQDAAAAAPRPGESLKNQGDPLGDAVLASTDPAAPPRTSALEGAGAGASVGASHALTTERPGTPPHAEAPASGAFATDAAGSDVPDTAQIGIDDFVKVDLRVARIVVAERIPKADKLLRLEVDLGYEQRQILSGIAEWYAPEDLVGRKIVIVANLAPRKMRGLESRGMLLAASAGENGKPILATFGEEIAVGTRLR